MSCYAEGCLDEVSTRYSIPEWFDYWSLTHSWCDYEEREVRHPEASLVTEKTYLTHLDGKCYRIDEFVVSEYVTTWRWGTCCARLTLETGALGDAIRLAIEFLNATEAEVSDLMEPNADGVVNLAAAWGGLGKAIESVLPSVSDAMSLVQLSEILDNLEPLRQRIQEILETIDRLCPLDGQIVCRRQISESDWQFHSARFEPIVRSITQITEIRCDQSLLKRPEGLVIPVEERAIYPVQPEAGELGDLLGESGGLWNEEFNDKLMEIIRRLREQCGSDR